ncbi:MAG: oligosaccharide flippase family protein [Promethearchaeota archaeon]
MKEPLSEGNSEYRTLASNTLFSFMINYVSLFFTFIYSFLLARLFSDEIWGFLIIATSFITITVTISGLLPPGYSFALNYYIPRYRALNENTKIKSVIKNAFIIKLGFLIPIFIFSVLLITLLRNFFDTDTVALFYILSPLIFVNSLNFIVTAINRGFNKFKYNLIFVIVKDGLQIIPLLILYIKGINVEIGVAAWIILISSTISLVGNSLFLFIMVFRIKPTGNEPDSFKEDLIKMFRYGGATAATDMFEKVWREFQLQGIGFISPNAATGFNISLNYQKLSEYSIKSFQFPLLNSFTTLNVKENYEQIDRIYKIAYRMTLFLILFISGILFFSVEFVLDFLFLEGRLIFSNFLRLILLATIFKILASFVQSHLNAQHKVKLSLVLRILYTSISIPLFFMGLYFGGVEGAILYGLIIGNLISMVIQIYATYRFGNIKLNIKKILIQYLTFFGPLVITILLKEFLIKDVSLNLIEDLGLTLFKNFDFISISIFIILFIFFNFMLKTVTTSDINSFESFLNKKRFFDKYLIKGLRVVKKFTRN